MTKRQNEYKLKKWVKTRFFLIFFNFKIETEK